jgi:hypothetical protein
VRRLTVVLLFLTISLAAAPAGAADGDGDGVGNARDRCPTVRAGQPDGCPLGRWRLAASNHHQTDFEFLRFASIAGRPIAGDWNGDGLSTVGTFDPTTERWRLQAGRTFTTTFGDTPGLNGGDMVSVVGDWNGDGKDTVGVYVPSSGKFLLRNSNTAGGADVVLAFGGPQPARYVVPVAGDWDGDGTDTIGVFRRDTDRWRLRNANSPGAPDLLFTFGRPGNVDQPVTGDWAGGGGVDGVGVGLMEDEGIYWFLRNTPTPGPAETHWSWGGSDGCGGCTHGLVAGDWDGDGSDTTGFRR